MPGCAGLMDMYFSLLLESTGLAADFRHLLETLLYRTIVLCCASSAVELI